MATYAEFLIILAGNSSMQIPGQISVQINSYDSPLIRLLSINLIIKAIYAQNCRRK